MPPEPVPGALIRGDEHGKHGDGKRPRRRALPMLPALDLVLSFLR